MIDALAKPKGETNELEQIELVLGDIKLNIDYSKLPGSYTAERVKRDRPDEYQAAIKLIASGFKFWLIGKRLNMDERTVRAIFYREITEVDKQRELIRNALFPAAMESIEHYHQQIPNAKGEKAGINMGIGLDKWMQLSGVPTAHIEIDHKIDCGAELAALLREAEEKVKTIKATVIEPAPAQLENGGSE